MIIFPKIDIIPIIVPQISFLDIYNNENNYFEMNPSIFIDENGSTNILVRCINYKKFASKKFTLYENNSNSIYYNISGTLEKNEKLNIESFDFSILNYEYNLPTNYSYWKGLEDIRFVKKNTVLVNVPELGREGNPSIFKANFQNNTISNFIQCYPNNIEKNWMPYSDNNMEKVIYSLNPFKIKSIEKDDIIEIEISESIKSKLIGFHGSTNGININCCEILFLIHINKNITTHRWLIFNILNNDIKLSDEFVFFKNSYIEFNCSLALYNERIFISIGVNDDKAYIIETCFTDIIESFPKYKNDENYPTIVTMLYDIRSMENNQIERNRKIDSYIDFSKKFLMKLPYPIIFFIDYNIDTYNSIYNFRKDLNLLDKTYIYMSDFKTTYFYKYLNRLEELQTTFHIINGEIEHETPLYVILNNNKFDCIDKTINLNPFNSTHLVWLDFGINHVAENTEKINEWILKVPDKIKQLCINPYTEAGSAKDYFRFIYHNLAGGLFSGSIENMKQYSNLFKKKTEEIYNDNWYQIDEAVMAMVERENPDLFDLFYGDYQGIISNYMYPIHNIDLILKGCQKLLDCNKTKIVYQLLCYSTPYFEENPNSEFIYSFIEKNIIVNYYHNNRKLLQKIIDLIVFKKTSSNKSDVEKISTLLENNRVNINFYDNKEEIL
jgi:hypothetical protein